MLCCSIWSSVFQNGAQDFVSFWTVSILSIFRLGWWLHRREWDTPDSCVTTKAWKIPTCHRYQVSTSCIKIGFLLGEKWGISCSCFFFRNCLSSGNEFQGSTGRKQGSLKGCNIANGMELRTESLINSMEICGKTTSASSAACTETWTLQFLLSGNRCQLGKWPFFQVKSNWW